MSNTRSPSWLATLSYRVSARPVLVYDLSSPRSGARTAEAFRTFFRDMAAGRRTNASGGLED